MRKVERLIFGAMSVIIGAILLPAEILASCICAILDWVGAVVYVLTGNNSLCDTMAEWHEGTAKILRSKPFG